MIRKIKYLKLFKKVLSFNGREHGRVCVHKGHKYFCSTLEKEIDGVKHYSGHLWIDWVYQGKLNLDFEPEDIYLYFDNGYAYLQAENKTVERERKGKPDRWTISYAKIKEDNLKGKWKTTGHYLPSQTGISGCQAVYSPLGVLLDWRKMVGAPSEENIGITDGKGGKVKTIMYARDYGYDSLGVGGDIHRVDGKYVLELAGLVNYKKVGQGFVNGLAECSTLTGKWKILNKILTNEKGKRIWATFFKDGGKWCALASLRNSSEIYLAEIITKDGSEPQGDSMKLEIAYNSNTNELICAEMQDATKYSWHLKNLQPRNTWIGSGATLKVDPKYRNRTKVFWCVVTVNGKTYSSDEMTVEYDVVELDPKPTNNTEYVEAIKAEMVKIDNSLSKIHSNLNKIE